MSFTLHMTDKVIKQSFAFVDVETGEILSKGFHRFPLSAIPDDCCSKYLQSFLRGVRFGRSVAVELLFEADGPSSIKEDFINFDLDLKEDIVTHVHPSSENI